MLVWAVFRSLAACSHGPEGESLGFGDGVRGDDRFRTISGGTHIAKRPVISDEMGAVAGEDYRALILDGESAMDAQTMDTLLALADAGLKIVFCGKVPERTPFLRDKAQDAQVRDKVRQLFTRTKNVCCVESKRELPAALQRLGVAPALRYLWNWRAAGLFTRWIHGTVLLLCFMRRNVRGA